MFILDVEPPAFTECPDTVLTGTDTSSNTSLVRWKEPVATDNSGDAVTITLTEGHVSGSRLTSGRYNIIYKAEDETGNSARRDCKFNVVVRGLWWY